jgi:hypothetical protein
MSQGYVLKLMPSNPDELRCFVQIYNELKIGPAKTPREVTPKTTFGYDTVNRCMAKMVQAGVLVQLGFSGHCRIREDNKK